MAHEHAKLAQIEEAAGHVEEAREAAALSMGTFKAVYGEVGARGPAAFYGLRGIIG